eukprot:TRINITY_DN2083_c0_g1_i1.p1 TRINITY_DN2083_c0_g1~~TRINITY_DN2083_c0_g1_i1.p1  ORF type:complete len:262 (+),score=75.54 TRINITY_DN2083_c0_g1_i1:49-786(+)
MFGIRKKLMSKAEEALGVDLDGDGQCGGVEGMSRDEMIQTAFTDALAEGVESAVVTAMRAGGFSGNSRVRIPWPEELGGSIEQAVQRFLPDYYDRFVATLNEAAEKASETAREVLLAAIRGLDLSTAVDLIRSPNPQACTDYFRSTSWAPLYDGMRGIVEEALHACNVTALWDDVMDAYARLPSAVKSMAGLPETLCTDIGDYSTNKAVHGLLVYVGDKEVGIRENPMGAVSSFVQQVFNPDFFA